jgi:ABC-type Fe3+/spermidine/putrescine transport system ATPase subunit
MAGITLKSVKNFALDDVTLDIRSLETLAIVGETGAGKTTLIKAVAGLVPFEGTLLFDGVPVHNLPVRNRNIGYLPQDLFLFPHLTVAGNVQYGLKGRNLSRDEVRSRGEAMMTLMGISHLADRYPATLSGGEKQRAALARAITPGPDVLLLDEPFSSLDVKTAKYLRLEFKRIVHELGLTTLFITHNLTEAEEMGDRIAVMNKGKILQVGTYDGIFLAPTHPVVSEFLGARTILNCKTCQPVGNGLVRVNTGKISLLVPDEERPVRKIAIPAHHVYLSRERPPGPDVNRFSGIIEAVTSERFLARFIIRISGEKIIAEMPEKEAKERGLQPGDTTHVIIRLRHIRVV